MAECTENGIQIFRSKMNLLKPKFKKWTLKEEVAVAKYISNHFARFKINKIEIMREMIIKLGLKCSEKQIKNKIDSMEKIFRMTKSKLENSEGVRIPEYQSTQKTPTSCPWYIIFDNLPWDKQPDYSHLLEPSTPEMIPLSPESTSQPPHFQIICTKHESQDSDVIENDQSVDLDMDYAPGTPTPVTVLPNLMPAENSNEIDVNCDNLLAKAILEKAASAERIAMEKIALEKYRIEKELEMKREQWAREERREKLRAQREEEREKANREFQLQLIQLFLKK